MSKTLKKLKFVGKLGKFLSTLILIICTVAGLACAFVLVSLLLGNDGSVFINGIKLIGVQVEGEITVGKIYLYTIEGIIACGLEVISCLLSIKYFKNCLKNETPFTIKSADQLKVIGILEIVFQLVTQLCTYLASLGLNYLQMGAGKYNFSLSITLSLGLALIVVSLICRYAAEQLEA